MDDPKPNQLEIEDLQNELSHVEEAIRGVPALYDMAASNQGTDPSGRQVMEWLPSHERDLYRRKDEIQKKLRTMGAF